MVAQPVGRRGILDGWVSRRYNSGQHLPAASAGQRHTDLIGSWMWLGSVCATGIGLVMLVVCATCLQGMHVNQSYVMENDWGDGSPRSRVTMSYPTNNGFGVVCWIFHAHMFWRTIRGMEAREAESPCRIPQTTDLVLFVGYSMPITLDPHEGGTIKQQLQSWTACAVDIKPRHSCAQTSTIADSFTTLIYNTVVTARTSDLPVRRLTRLVHRCAASCRTRARTTRFPFDPGGAARFPFDPGGGRHLWHSNFDPMHPSSLLRASAWITNQHQKQRGGRLPRRSHTVNAPPSLYSPLH